MHCLETLVKYTTIGMRLKSFESPTIETYLLYMLILFKGLIDTNKSFISDYFRVLDYI